MLMLAVRLQGKYTEADPLYLRAIEIRERVLGADHPDLAISLSTRGQLLRAQVCVFVPSILAPGCTPFGVVLTVTYQPGSHRSFFIFYFVFLPRLFHLRFWPFSIFQSERVQQIPSLYCTHEQIAFHCKVASEPLSVRVEPWTLLLVG